MGKHRKDGRGRQGGRGVTGQSQDQPAAEERTTGAQPGTQDGSPGASRKNRRRFGHN